MKASLFLLALKVCHSASLECARMMPENGNGADILGADVVALLRRRQQRMQHLDRRLEHFDEFEDALVGAVQAARIAVGVGIVLRIASPACGCRPCRPARRCPGCSRRRARSWRCAIWRSRDGCILTTRNLEISPSNSSSRFRHQGLISPRQPPRRDAVLLLAASGPWCSGSKRLSGLSKTGLISSPAFST